MLQRLPIGLAQVKPGNTFEHLLFSNTFAYSLYWAKEITKKVYNNIMISATVQYKNECCFYES